MVDTIVNAEEALRRLEEGNSRYAARAHGNEAAEPPPREELPQEQNPFAVILGCSDARVPAEYIFDQGPGDLFVIRVAGNIVAPSQLGSVEFAAGQFGTRLVVVLGHTRCGAVQATLQALRQPKTDISPNLRAIVSFIGPAVEPLLSPAGAAAAGPDDEELVNRAVRANVAASVARVRGESAILRELISSSGLRVVGAEYSLRTGRVTFLDHVADG
ncbi:MAG: carbonic anhydrase [Woeseiaceae bacterium]|nr:carbonic anhydrase [Woeseiaceae bacterium]